MHTEKLLTRLFFVLALFVFGGASVRKSLAQQDQGINSIGPVCADGDRQVCEEEPTPSGGKLFFYWV